MEYDIDRKRVESDLTNPSHPSHCPPPLSTPRQTDVTPLHHAAAFGPLACLQALLEADKGSESWRDGAGWQPLHYAAHSGNVACLEALLLAAGTEVDARNIEGLTPLHLAAREGHLESVKALLAKGAAKELDTSVRTHHHTCSLCSAGPSRTRALSP